MRKRPLVLIGCVFLAGLVYQRYFKWSMAVVGLLFLLRELWIGRQTGNFRNAAGRSVILLSAFLLGILHMQQEEAFRAAYMSKIEDGSSVAIWGELIKMESTDYGKRGTLSDCYIDFGEGAMPCNDIMVYTSNDQYRLGQIHKITGKVNMFSKARNEGNFNALIYYQSIKIDFAVEEESCVILQEDVSVWKGVLWSLKEKMMAVYVACMDMKAAGFYHAMVLGDKDNLDETLKDLFLLGGISHILAISGLHVSILGRGIYRILRQGGIGFAISGLCGGLLLVAYSIMVGNSVSTVRAVGMMLLFFLAQWFGRSYDMLNALGGMVLFLLWENPFLMENSGFWFSVTALLGVGVVGKELSKKIDLSNEKKNQKKHFFDLSGLWMSLGITLTTLPVTALSYYEVPVYSVVVNFLVLPLLAPVFCLAIVGGLLGACGLSQSVTALLLIPCQWLVSFYEWICGIVSKLPNPTVICGKPESWQVIVYYLALLMGVYVMSSLKEEKESWQNKILKKRNIVLIAMSFVCGLCLFFPKSKPFEISFLDVGQGDGIYICAGDGTTYFIDGGSLNVSEVGKNRILPFLKSKQVASIDYWFVSHCDTDHVSGLLELLENNYKVENIVLYEQSSENENYLNLLKKAHKVESNVIFMKAGDKVCSSDLEICCIAPESVQVGVGEMNSNENSLVLLTEYQPEEGQNFTALFAGDISTEIENSLCEQGLLKDVNLVKANHHGSNYSNGENWFGATHPEYIVVSCSKKNAYGHPGAKAVERMEACGAKILYTMEMGQVKVEMKTGKVNILGE